MKKLTQEEKDHRQSIIAAFKAKKTIQIKFQDWKWQDMYNTTRMHFPWGDKRFQYRIKPVESK